MKFSIAKPNPDGIIIILEQDDGTVLELYMDNIDANFFANKILQVSDMSMTVFVDQMEAQG